MRRSQISLVALRSCSKLLFPVIGYISFVFLALPSVQAFQKSPSSSLLLHRHRSKVSDVAARQALLTSSLSLSTSSSYSFSDERTQQFMESSISKLQQLDLTEYISRATTQIQTISDEKKWSQLFADTLLYPLDDLQSLWQQFVSLPITAQLSIVAIPFAIYTIVFLLQLPNPPEGYRRGYEPYARGMYDPLVAKAYYSKHPLLVARRTLQLLKYSNRFLFNILVDKYIRRDQEGTYNKERAAELLDLINKAGPTAIKVGQALSVRPDLIPYEYADALSTLQDRVPPFPSSKARELLLEELGPVGMEKIKEILIDTPVASASIGQVYRGTARLSGNSNGSGGGGGSGGRICEVAIKVQRPDVLSEIALDLHIVREFAPIYQKLTGAATDFQSLANEWGRGFIAELDYSDEAYNTKRFNQEMTNRGLYSAVTAPVVIDELSTKRILTTEWVYGTRLDQSTADDIPRLCTVALNAYLVMLLETGCLHCDPHPGNLLRRDDGRLCILDFGMMLKVDKNLQYTLLETVSHLTSEQYERLPVDLVNLGFLKAERLETVKASGFLEPLSLLLKQAGKGGGGKKVRERIFAEYRDKFPGVDDDELRVLMREDMKSRMEEARKRESAVSGITLEVEELQKRNRDAFQIPEWFLYTSRAFLTLEGICLQADENYSIIQSCFPYVAKRLFKDDSPQAQAALKELLYGAGNALSAKRLTDFAEGISTYISTTQGSPSSSLSTSATKTNDTGKSKSQTAQESLELVKLGADIILAPQGNLIQTIIVDEGVSALNAQIKDVLRLALLENPTRIRSGLPLNLGNLLPFPLEREFTPFLNKTDDEARAQNLINQMMELVDIQGKSTRESSPIMSSLSRRGVELDADQIAILSKAVRENFPKYAPLVAGLGVKFSSTLLRKISDDIERALEEGQEISAADRLIRVIAKRMSSVAKQAADRIQV